MRENILLTSHYLFILLTWRKSNHKNHVNDKENEEIFLQHLIDHNHEWPNQSKTPETQKKHVNCDPPYENTSYQTLYISETGFQKGFKRVSNGFPTGFLSVSEAFPMKARVSKRFLKRFQSREGFLKCFQKCPKRFRKGF